MIRLFVGCSVGEDIESQQVLEYSVRRHASEPVEITWMQQARKGFWSGWNTSNWATPFTGFRWGIPAACAYEGRAIYCDSDFIFVADIAELWRQEIPGALLIRRTEGKLRTCCLLFDCAEMRRHLPIIENVKGMADPNDAMRKYFSAHRELMAPYEGDWNCIDLKGYDAIDDPRIKAIHYSRMEVQPHLRYAIPRLKAEGRTHWYDGELGTHWRPDLVALFDALYLEAQAAGYTTEKYAVEPFGTYKKKSHKGRPAKVVSG